MIHETVTSPESAKLDKIIEMLSCMACIINRPQYSADVIEHPVCINGNWHFVIVQFANGQVSDQLELDTGIPCTEPAPISLDFEIKTRQRCDAVTRTIWEQCYSVYLADPQDPSTLTEILIGAEHDTGILCNQADPIDIPLCDPS